MQHRIADHQLDRGLSCHPVARAWAAIDRWNGRSGGSSMCRRMAPATAENAKLEKPAHHAAEEHGPAQHRSFSEHLHSRSRDFAISEWRSTYRLRDAPAPSGMLS